MPEDKKICPKCGATREQTEEVCAIPAARQPKSGASGIKEEVVFLVTPLACPKCHFVELYHYVKKT